MNFNQTLGDMTNLQMEDADGLEDELTLFNLVLS